MSLRVEIKTKLSNQTKRLEGIRIEKHLRLIIRKDRLLDFSKTKLKKT